MSMRAIMGALALTFLVSTASFSDGNIDRPEPGMRIGAIAYCLTDDIDVPLLLAATVKHKGHMGYQKFINRHPHCSDARMGEGQTIEVTLVEKVWTSGWLLDGRRVLVDIWKFSVHGGITGFTWNLAPDGDSI